MEMRPSCGCEEDCEGGLAELDERIEIYANTMSGLTKIMQDLLDRMDKLQKRVELGTVNIIENSKAIDLINGELNDSSRMIADFGDIQKDHIAWWNEHFSNRGAMDANGELRAVITQGGSVVHKAYDASSPTHKVLKDGTVVTITEFTRHKDLVWARIGKNEWIHGGWKAVDDKG